MMNKDPELAIEEVFRHLPQIDSLTEADIQHEYDDLRVRWQSRLLAQSDKMRMRELLLENLRKYVSWHEFRGIAVSTKQNYIQLNTLLRDKAGPEYVLAIRVWRSCDALYACGSSDFTQERTNPTGTSADSEATDKPSKITSPKESVKSPLSPLMAAGSTASAERHGVESAKPGETMCKQCGHAMAGGDIVVCRHCGWVDWGVVIAPAVFCAVFVGIGVLLCNPGFWRWAWLVMGAICGWIDVAMTFDAMASTKQQKGIGVVGVLCVSLVGIGVLVCNPGFWRWLWIVMNAICGWIAVVMTIDAMASTEQHKWTDKETPHPRATDARSRGIKFPISIHLSGVKPLANELDGLAHRNGHDDLDRLREERATDNNVLFQVFYIHFIPTAPWVEPLAHGLTGHNERLFR